MSPKFWRSLLILRRDVKGEVINRRMSSAKRAHLCVFCPQFTPLMFGSDLIAMARVSNARAKTSGDKGQPCLVPLAILMGVEKYP